MFKTLNIIHHGKKNNGCMRQGCFYSKKIIQNRRILHKRVITDLYRSNCVYDFITPIHSDKIRLTKNYHTHHNYDWFRTYIFTKSRESYKACRLIIINDNVFDGVMCWIIPTNSIIFRLNLILSHVYAIILKLKNYWYHFDNYGKWK